MLRDIKIKGRMRRHIWAWPQEDEKTLFACEFQEGDEIVISIEFGDVWCVLMEVPRNV